MVLEVAIGESPERKIPWKESRRVEKNWQNRYLGQHQVYQRAVIAHLHNCSAFTLDRLRLLDLFAKSTWKSELNSRNRIKGKFSYRRWNRFRCSSCEEACRNRNDQGEPLVITFNVAASNYPSNAFPDLYKWLREPVKGCSFDQVYSSDLYDLSVGGIS